MLLPSSLARKSDVIVVFMCWTLAELAYGGCNQKLAVKSGEVLELTSPNYPLNFPRQSHCFYDLSTRLSAGDVISVSVEYVSLSCNDGDNVLHVYDAFITSPRYLGRVCDGGQTEFVAPKESLYLVFKSGNKTSRGFKLKVKAKPDFRQCYNDEAKVMLAQSKPQEIVSPFYPYEVAPNVHCRWLLKAPPGYRVSLDVLHSDMKGSNDCFNFGLYLFDGKTTYDDEKLAEICDDGLMSYDSSDNYLLVVFSSGPHVLHSGGGVKLAFHSALVDPDAVPKDYSLLFILIGAFLAAVAFTVIMIIFRFFILPARRKAAARRYSPRHRVLNLETGQTTMTSLTTEPPPPYSDNNSTNTHSNFNNNNNNKRSLTASLCCCTSRDSNVTEELNQDVMTYASRVTPWTTDNLPLGNISNLDNESMDRVMNLLRSGVPLSEVLQNIYSDEIIVNRPLSESSVNDYQELPSVSCLRTYSGRSNTEHIYSDALENTVSPSPEFRSVDSGYHDGQHCGDETESEVDDTEIEKDNAKNTDAHERLRDENTLRTVTDSTAESSDSNERFNTSAVSCENSGLNNESTMSSANNKTSSSNYEDNKKVNNSRNRRLDDEGYEVPSTMAFYNRPNIEHQEEEEPIYEKLQHDVVSL